jgi:aerobic carbon-monoxide dehydrogenase small subunit
MMDTIKITFWVNGDKATLEVTPSETLLEIIRERLFLTGAKESCGLGACGACTVIMNGVPVRSCLILAVEADGADIVTIEGLQRSGRLHPLQQSFMDNGAVQCGFCAPGMILTAKALLDRKEKPDREEIVETISSNACRCTGYKKIVAAVEEAAKAIL